MKSFGIRIALALIAAASLMGCSVVSGIAGNVDQAKLVVQVATMKVIEAGPDRPARAEKVKEIADSAKKLLDVQAVSVDDLAQLARERIAKLDLAPSDQLLSGLLVDAVVQDLKVKVGEGVIPPEYKVRVNTVLGWVSSVSVYYSY